MCGRLREHVDRPHAAQRVARLDELRGVGRKRRRVAGDVDDARRRGLDDPPHDLRPTGPRAAGRRRARRGARRSRRARAAPGGRRRRRSARCRSRCGARWRSRRRSPPRRARGPRPRRRAAPATGRSCRSRRTGRRRAPSPAARRTRPRSPYRRSAISVLVWKNASALMRKRSPPSSSSMASVPCRTSVLPPGGGLADVERPRPHDAAGADRLGEAVEVERASSEVTRRTCSSPVRRPSRTTRLRSRPICARRS